MAEPSTSSVGTALANAVRVSQGYSAAARVASTGLLATMETLRESLSGRLASSAAEDVEAQRAAAASAIGADQALGSIEPILRQLALSYDLDSAQLGELGQVMQDLYDKLAENNQHVKQRALVYGTPAAGGANVGTGTCLRLTVDENGTELQGWFADPGGLTLECEADQTTNGQTLRETFRIRGTAESPDLLAQEGYGQAIDESGIPVHSADLTSRSGTLTNPSFTSVTLNGSTLTGITGWTPLASIGNYENNTAATYIYLDSAGSGGTARSIRQIADDTLTQELVTTARADLPRGTPFLVGVRVYRRNSCDGTLTLRLSSAETSGGISRAVTVTGLAAGWNTVYFEVTPGLNAWPKNFNASGLKFSIQLAGRTTGSLYYSDLLFAPYTRIGGLGDGREGRGAMGTYVALVSGQVPFMRLDQFVLTDTEVEADRGEIAFWLARYGLGYLPSVDDATQVPASGGRTLTFADANPDTITASSGDFVADGYKVGMTIVVAGTTSNNGSYKVAIVGTTVLTLEASEALTAEGPLSATATLDGTAYFPDAT